MLSIMLSVFIDVYCASQIKAVEEMSDGESCNSRRQANMSGYQTTGNVKQDRSDAAVTE